MKLVGQVLIPASQKIVWDALNDKDVLAKCIPGCDQIEQLSPTELRATVKAKIGPVSASFKGQVTLSELNPPNSYRISGEGSGGAAGFAKGGASVSLAPEGDQCRLSYEVDASIGGKLAQIGQRLVDGAAKKMADEFFTAFAELVGTPQAEVAGQDSHGTPPPSNQASGGLPTAAWLGGLIAIVLALVAFSLSH
jgi:carbon monoxide dehydrogenase subunit G